MVPIDHPKQKGLLLVTTYIIKTEEMKLVSYEKTRAYWLNFMMLEGTLRAPGEEKSNHQ